MKLRARVMRYAHGPQFALTGPNGRIKLALVDAGSGIPTEEIGDLFEALAKVIGEFEFKFAGEIDAG